MYKRLEESLGEQPAKDMIKGGLVAYMLLYVPFLSPLSIFGWNYSHKLHTTVHTFTIQEESSLIPL